MAKEDEVQTLVDTPSAGAGRGPIQAGSYRMSAVGILRQRAEGMRQRAAGYEALADALEVFQEDEEGNAHPPLCIGELGEVAIWDMVSRLRD